MTCRMTIRLGAACIGLAGILAGCQPAQTSGPPAESPKAQVENDPQAGHAKADTAGKVATDVPATLNDPCFPGRGTPLPASCGVDVADPATVADPKAVAGDTAKVSTDGGQTLDDPCFQGRGSALPSYCGS